MGFVKSPEDLDEMRGKKGEFYDAEVLTTYFETKPEVVKRLLPAPLKPGSFPFAFAFVANYPKTNFGVTYLESALFLQAEFNGEIGYYCLSMPVTNEMALILGREIFGYPKKMGRIGLNRSGQDVEGWTERHGVRFFEVRAKLTGTFNDQMAQMMITGTLSSGANPVIYNFKYFPSPERHGFDYNPRLIREEIVIRPSSVELGEAELTFNPSDHDPWGEVEIVRVLGAIYSVGNNTMLPGKVVAEADPAAFEPFSYMKLDY